MILAHQGGWDEALLVIGPLLLIAWLLSVAKKRADRLHPKSTPTDEAGVSR